MNFWSNQLQSDTSFRNQVKTQLVSSG